MQIKRMISNTYNIIVMERASHGPRCGPRMLSDTRPSAGMISRPSAGIDLRTPAGPIPPFVLMQMHELQLLAQHKLNEYTINQIV